MVPPKGLGGLYRSEVQYQGFRRALKQIPNRMAVRVYGDFEGLQGVFWALKGVGAE